MSDEEDRHRLRCYLSQKVEEARNARAELAAFGDRLTPVGRAGLVMYDTNIKIIEDLAASEGLKLDSALAVGDFAPRVPKPIPHR